METRQTGRGVNDVATGEDIGLTDDSLAIAITRTTVVLISGGRHCAQVLPGLRWETWIVGWWFPRFEVNGSARDRGGGRLGEMWPTVRLLRDVGLLRISGVRAGEMN